MKITNLYVRFYRSFNFDFMRKYRPGSKSLPWEEMSEDLWYPFVRVPIESGITTIVGANESGKSQLLNALGAALTGDGFSFADFCRFSQFFVVNDTMRLPEFGIELSVTPDEAQRLAACLGEGVPTSFDRFALFRCDNQLDAYVVVSNTWTRFDVLETGVAQLEAMLPTSFRIDASVPLPSSASIRSLARGLGAAETIPSRRQRATLMSGVIDNYPSLLAAPDSIVQHAASWLTQDEVTASPDEYGVTQEQLADDLLVKVAKVQRQAFVDLEQALRDGDDGYANGIVDGINRALAAALNLKRWWTQDEQFQLLVSPREFDLAFTIRDRTGTEYSFGERSMGLKYFLSYLVQYLAHDPVEGRTELLLMDEPDAYLSSQGQQDLLRVLAAFVEDEEYSDTRQVVYVTHSPFLIDKNHAERIRVIEKGSGSEGTRVVKRAGRNHYEPLRSAFGTFVGETTFISNCNLMIEGESDQILLAGMSSVVHEVSEAESDSLDLNAVTLVHAGGASHIPYMVYLARGRDVDHPAVIVLLDKDVEGNTQRKKIKRGGPQHKPMIDDSLVYQFGDGDVAFSTERTDGDITIEDLVPIELCAEAAKQYAVEFFYGEEGAFPDAAAIRKFEPNKGHLNATQAAFCKLLDDDFHLDKVGFARNLIEVIKKERADDDPLAASVLQAIDNFKSLFQALNAVRRQALREYRDEHVTQRIRRQVDSFLRDHETSHPQNEQVLFLFEAITAVLDDTNEADAVTVRLRAIEREYGLRGAATDRVRDLDKLRDALRSIEYAGRQAIEEEIDLGSVESDEVSAQPKAAAVVEP